MDFFQHQDSARRRTGWLLFLFLVAVAAIVLAIYAVFAVVFHKPWDPRLFATVTLGTVLVIAAGSLYKIAELSSGGETVALMLGGRLVDPSTTDLAERRLLNVVEEMALASGIPVPSVFVLDREKSINAFAAGHSPQNAVIGVSQGSLTYLSRDELQGVMAHEFSHIFNGDMRLNLRLMGLLHGILLLAIIGYYVLRLSPRSSGGSDKKGGAAAIVLVGLGLLVIGFVGLFFARLIRSSVSRQREYLADASAVQFTRYPGGIAGALKKIGGLAEASRIRDAHADETSHLFFGDAFAGSLFNLFATHPPLPERIQRIDPAFDGTFPETQPVDEAEGTEAASERAGGRAAAGAEAMMAGLVGAAGMIEASGQDVVGRVGTVAPEHLSYAAALIEKIPERLVRSASEPFGARAVVFAVLLNREEDVRRRQLAAIQTGVEEACCRELAAIAPLVDQIPDEARLPLVDRASPALKQLSPRQYSAFRGAVDALVKADGKISLLEYTIQAMLFRALDVHFGLAKPPRIQYYAVAGLLKPAAAVLSMLAHAGHSDEADARRAFDLGMRELGHDGVLLSKDQCTLSRFDAALSELAKAAPKVKRPLVAACAACAAADGKVTLREAELLRAVAAVLGCPMPPMASP